MQAAGASVSESFLDWGAAVAREPRPLSRLLGLCLGRDCIRGANRNQKPTASSSIFLARPPKEANGFLCFLAFFDFVPPPLPLSSEMLGG